MNSELFDFSRLASDEKTELLTQFFKLYHVIIDNNGIVIHASNDFLQLVGLVASECIGHEFSLLLAAGESSFSQATKVIAASSAIELSLLHADGTTRLVDLTVTDVIISSQFFKVISHFCIVIGNEEQHNRQLFEQSAIAEFLLVPDELNIVAANSNAQLLCGVSETALQQMKFSDVVDLSHQQLSTEFKKLYADVSGSFNLNLTVASGEQQYVKLTVNPVELGGRSLLHVQAINITEYKDHIEQLYQAVDLNDSLFNLLPMAALLMDSFGVIAKLNQAMAELLGKASQDLLGQHVQTVLPGALTSQISPMESSSSPVSLELNGQLLDVEFSQYPLRDRQDLSQGLLLTIVATESTQLPLRLRSLETVDEMSLVAIFSFDLQGNFIYVNEGFERQSRYKAHQLIGRNFSLLNEQSNDPFVLKNMWNALNDKCSWRGAIKFNQSHGNCYWADVSLKPVLDTAGEIEYFVGVSIDTTRQKELQEAGVFLANYDIATGLANEILAKDRLEGMLSRARRRKLTVAVVYLDITEIESINYEFGAVKSSEILSTYCSMMRSALRSEDTLVRMSQTRLAILLPDLPNTSALEVVAAKIDKVNQQPIAVGDDCFDLEVRLGVAYYPDQGADAESLFLNAESSLLRAWHSNERIGCFGEQHNEQAIKHFNLRRDIVSALENQQFEILYQPICDLSTNQVVTLEVALQWQHPIHGSIFGDDIFAIAEASGIMAELGLWSLDKACADLHHWHQQGYTELSIAVNLSHGQLRNRHIADQFANILKANNVAPRLVALELPLSYIATQWLDFDVILQELSLLGLTLQYDKFGERGAYISDLSNFPFSGLKLSANYVAQLDESPSSANLIQGIVNMAQALDMTVTAIGVEQLSQLVQLQEMGCHYAQGDFTCRLSSRDEIDTYLIQQDGYQQLSWE